MAGQVVTDLTISAIAETATGSGIWKVTALPTTGVATTRPLVVDPTNGYQFFYAGVEAPNPKEFYVGRRLVVDIGFTQSS